MQTENVQQQQQQQKQQQVQGAQESQGMEQEIGQEIQNIANRIKSDIEKELNQAFKMFNVIESQPLTDESQPQGKSYSMKVKTGDNEHLKLQATQPYPGSHWLSLVDEYFNGISPFENLLTSFDPFRVGYNSIQDLANRLKHDIERELNRNFNTFNVMEYYPILTDPEHTSYYMRIKTDDNGHVRVKTIKKLPGSDWKTHVEEYTRGKPSLQGSEKKTEALKGETRGSQAMETEKIKEQQATSSTSA